MLYLFPMPMCSTVATKTIRGIRNCFNKHLNKSAAISYHQSLKPDPFCSAATCTVDCFVAHGDQRGDLHYRMNLVCCRKSSCCAIRCMTLKGKLYDSYLGDHSSSRRASLHGECTVPARFQARALPIRKMVLITFC